MSYRYSRNKVSTAQPTVGGRLPIGSSHRSNPFFPVFPCQLGAYRTKAAVLSEAVVATWSATALSQCDHRRN